ncbi:MAG: desulfoferrodoxin family protein [Candidatus Atribacteria bacterium]|nr:desulfoferrodoxin family protein [Candidatus Atribacteria bacterium]
MSSFGDYLKGQDKEGKEKHTPTIEIVREGENICPLVRITVGKETPHPNTVEHHIKWIDLFGIKKENEQLIHISTFDLGPTIAFPEVSVHVLLDEMESLIAISYCNIHGAWESQVKVMPACRAASLCGAGRV